MVYHITSRGNERKEIYLGALIGSVMPTARHDDQPESHTTNAIPRGIFATRKPWRPNPIGLDLVELVQHEGNRLWVKGLDAMEDSPVLDIKPYPEWVIGRLIVVIIFFGPKACAIAGPAAAALALSC